MRYLESTRIVGAVCLLVGIAIGAGFMATRADAPAPPPAEQVRAWTEAGYSPEEARRIVLAKHFAQPTARTTAPPATRPPPADWSPGAGLPPARARDCARLAGAHFPDPELWRRALIQAGPPWEAFAMQSSEIPPEQRVVALVAAWQGLCGRGGKPGASKTPG